MNEADRIAIKVASSLMLVAARIIPFNLHLLSSRGLQLHHLLSSSLTSMSCTPLHAVKISVLTQIHDYFFKTRIYFFASRMGMICTLKVPARQKIKAASHSQTVGTSSAEDSEGKPSGLETLLASTMDHNT